MKTKFAALLLSAFLGFGSLVALPALASTGDCTINGGNAVCDGSNLEALRGNTKITSLTLLKAPLKGDVLSSMQAMVSLEYHGNINVDLREVLKAPAITSFHAAFETQETRVQAGKKFKLPTFTTFDGSPFSLEIGNYFENDGWDIPPVKQAGFNSFIAPEQTYIRFLEGYYVGEHKSDGKSIQWSVNIGDQQTVSSYEELSWLGTGRLSVYYTPDGGSSVLNPSATTVPTGTGVSVSGTKTSTGFAMKTSCTWLRGSSLIKAPKLESNGGCSYKLTKADSGKKITVKATHNDYWGPSEYWESTTDTFSKTFTVQDPILLKLGKVGAVAVGKKIAPKVTGAPAGAKLNYQWFRGQSYIKGATSSTYKPTAADISKQLSYTVTGRKPGMFSVKHTSYSSDKVVKGKYAVTKAPTVSGKTVYVQTLKVNPGSRSNKPSKFTYQWLRDGKAIKNSTKTTYKLGLSDIGQNISVKVTASGSGFAAQTSTTSKTKSIAKAKFIVKTNASVSGKMKAGSKLTAKTGTWSPKPEKYKYQWYRSGAPISKATKSTYMMTTRDRGKVVYVKVTATKKGYTSRTSTSSVK